MRGVEENVKSNFQVNPVKVIIKDSLTMLDHFLCRLWSDARSISNAFTVLKCHFAYEFSAVLILIPFFNAFGSSEKLHGNFYMKRVI